MPELSNDFLEGYTKAKNEDEAELNKTRSYIINLEKEYNLLAQQAKKDIAYIEENKQYIELGRALKTILDYVRNNNVE